MFDRADSRGEPGLHYPAVLDGIVAPIYFRHLFGSALLTAPT